MNWYKKSQNEYDPETIRKHMDEFMSSSQQNDTEADNFAIDLRSKPISMKQNIKKSINKKIHELGNYHIEIPLDRIFDILAEHRIIALQEDGTPWSGLLIGGAECGSEKARNQFVNFLLAHNPNEDIYAINPFSEETFKVPNSGYEFLKNRLFLAWCKMPSGKYEIVSYIS